jgi:hypothetical protein
MPEDELVQIELTLNRFRKLVTELQKGAIHRNSFEPWEIEILMDLENCPVKRRRRLDILGQYLRAVEHQMESGSAVPMRLSEFLATRTQKQRRSAS